MLSVVCCLLFCCLLFAVRGVMHSTVCCLLSAARWLLSDVCCLLFAVCCSTVCFVLPFVCCLISAFLARICKLKEPWNPFLSISIIFHLFFYIRHCFTKPVCLYASQLQYTECRQVSKTDFYSVYVHKVQHNLPFSA
jgi:hypothetical protein